MFRRTVSGLLLALLIIGFFVPTFNVHPVWASGTIYIRADGSIDPPTVPISTVDKVTYVLTDNIYDSLVVERDNIMVDGAGYTVTGRGSGSGNGITLTDGNNVTVRDMTILYFYNGIYLDSSSNNILSGNNVTAHNWYGIWLKSSSSNTLSDNNVIANHWYGIYLVASSNNALFGNNVANNEQGIGLGSSSNNALFGNNVTANNWYGIWLGASSNNTLSGNNVTANNRSGICLYYSSNNTLSGNKVMANNEGIRLEGFSNNTLSGNNVTANNYCGIRLYSSTNNILSGNNVMANNGNGIDLSRGTNNTLSGNVMGGNRYNFGVTGYSLSEYLQSVDTSNLVDGKPVYYFVNQSDLVVNAAAYPEVGYLGFVNCFNVTVQGMNLTNNNEGLLLAFTNDSKITDNNAANNFFGIMLASSCGNNVLSRNNVTNNMHGIFLESSCHNNVLSDNNVTANESGGIWLNDPCDNNVLSRNNVTNNEYGIWLGSPNNIVSGNNVANNEYGIILNYSSSNNSIFHNSFVNNTNQINSRGRANIWEDGYPSGGNYWSDYNGTDYYCGPYQNATGSDGIGDTPYIIDSNNPDNYPFMEPYGWESYPLPVEANVTVMDQTARRTAMHFMVSGPSGDFGYANVTMPIGFNTTQINVLIDSEPVVPPFPIITTNGTHYFTYVEFPLSTHTVTVKYALTDVALSGTDIAKTIIGRGYSLNMNLTVVNLGTLDESFDVEVYANSTVVMTQPFDLKIGGSVNLTCKWNTAAFVFGNYTISAYVPPMEGEDNLANNNRSYDIPIHVSVPGDVSGPTVGVYDGTANMRDINYLIMLFNTNTSSPNWKPNADINDDCTVNMREIQIAILNFNKHE